MSATATRTLYEDWAARRGALRSSGEGDIPAAMARILDYLLVRYRNAPEAQAPARALPRSELCVNDRALVLHAHLWHAPWTAVQSPAAARRRVSEVLARMQAPREPLLDTDPRMIDLRGPQMRQRASRLHDERLRMLLGPATERMDGLRLLWMFGDLHDVGLLCDLLEMPLPADAGPEEREAMLWVLERLSGRDGPQRWSSDSLYENWRERHWACEQLWLLGDRTQQVGVLLGSLLQHYLDRPEAQVKAVAVTGVETAQNPRERIVEAYTLPNVYPPTSSISYERWRLFLPERGYHVIVRAPAAEVQGWTNSARKNLLNAAESERLEALKMLTEVGTLQDVGLMCDLLALTQERQSSLERAAMVDVIRSRAKNWFHYLGRY